MGYKLYIYNHWLRWFQRFSEIKLSKCHIWIRIHTDWYWVELKPPISCMFIFNWRIRKQSGTLWGNVLLFVGWLSWANLRTTGKEWWWANLGPHWQKCVVMCRPQSAETMQKVIRSNSSLFQFLNLSQETPWLPVSWCLGRRCNWLDSNAVRELAVAIKEPSWDVQCLSRSFAPSEQVRGSESERQL